MAGAPGGQSSRLLSARISWPNSTAILNSTARCSCGFPQSGDHSDSLPLELKHEFKLLGHVDSDSAHVDTRQQRCPEVSGWRREEGPAGRVERRIRWIFDRCHPSLRLTLPPAATLCPAPFEMSTQISTSSSEPYQRNGEGRRRARRAAADSGERMPRTNAGPRRAPRYAPIADTGGPTS